MLYEGCDPIATTRPWRKALRRLRNRPSSDRGPVLFLALLRLAAIFRSEVIAYSATSVNSASMASDEAAFSGGPISTALSRAMPPFVSARRLRSACRLHPSQSDYVGVL